MTIEPATTNLGEYTLTKNPPKESLITPLPPTTKTALRNPLNITRQLVFRYLAKSVIGFYCDHLLPMIQAIKIMINDPEITEQPLKDYYGARYPAIINFLNRAQYQQERIKTYYEGLNPKTILNEDLNSERFKAFSENVARTPLIDLGIYKIFYVLIRSTTLINMSIPAESFAEENRKYKSYEIDEKERQLIEKKDKEDSDYKEDE